MQREHSGGGYGGPTVCNFSLASPAFLSQPSDYEFNSLYTSMFFPPCAASLPDYSSDESSSTARSTGTQPLDMLTSHLARSQFLVDHLQYHQDLMDRQTIVLSHLKDMAKQAQALRQENINLKMANMDLSNRLNLLLKASSDYGNPFTSQLANLDSIDEGLRRMYSFGLKESEDGGSLTRGWNDVMAAAEDHQECPSPTSVVDSIQAESGSGVQRVMLPKSISVRSSGYLKTVHAAGRSSSARVKGQNRTKSRDAAQRVYVRGGKEEEQPLELEVYNQGMFKTELCNKWQETGACPYGKNCQFAHGLEELRPVLRHPRYKTEVCRMVLNGDPCPYGHRCHFRHTLTDEEKLTRSLDPAESLRC